MLPLVLGTLGAALLASEQKAPEKPVLRSIDAWCPRRGGLVDRPPAPIDPAAVKAARGPRAWVPIELGLDWLYMDREEKLEWFEERFARARPWALDLPFDIEMSVQASTWPDWNLFPEVVAGHSVASPSGAFRWLNKVLGKGHVLEIREPEGTFTPDPSDFDGETLDQVYVDHVWRGNVMFDGPVLIPVVFEGSTLWMSHTPSEVLTQRAPMLSRECRGRVVVGGLGMGWLLAQVAAVPEVKEVVLVERSAELVDWILPRLADRLPADKPIRVAVGDVHDVLPWLRADLALLDIWPTWSEVERETKRLMQRCAGIEAFWSWGYDWPARCRKNPAFGRGGMQ